MELSAVHDVHMAINLAHRFVYFVPEAAEEYGRIGATGRGAYFASRVAPLGAVPDPVIVATFYNFSPHAVAGADLPAVWAVTTPAALQTARFAAAERALRRVGPVTSRSPRPGASSILSWRAWTWRASPSPRPMPPSPCPPTR